MVKSLRGLQDRLIEDELKPRTKEPVVIPPERMRHAMEFLRTVNFRAMFPEHARLLGLVGEEVNFELGFYILVSRILARPLHGKVKSASAAGKSTLLDVLARICPPEDLLRLSALSPQVLYYMEDLAHRVIVLEEDAGMDFAMYPLKILQTEGILRKGTVFRDPTTGKSSAVEVEAKGPVASLVASTSTLENEEEDNRYLILAMNESREQTEAILAYQRELETLDRDELDEESSRIAELYRDILRLIKGRPVINPYAPRLLFVIRRHRFRRDQPKVLRLVRLITLANQYLRETYSETRGGAVKEYLLSTIGDNVLALRLAGHALEKSLDEMSPHTRHFLSQFRELVDEMGKESGKEKRFCRTLRRDLARKTGLSASTVHAHLQALHRLDYIVFHRDERRRDRIELVDDDPLTAASGIPDPEGLARDLAQWEGELRASSPGRPDFWRVKGGIPE
jgi:DNA-binding MarR family transcriptional regulator